MKHETKQVHLLDIKFDESVYPRVDGHDPRHVQSIYDNLESIEREAEHIFVNQDLKILNGRHRHLAHLKRADGENPLITVNVIVTRDSKEDADISFSMGAKAAKPYTSNDRKSYCRKLYALGYSLDSVAEKALVSKSFATTSTKKQRDDEKEKRNKTIQDMFMACYSIDEIAEKINATNKTIERETKRLRQSSTKNKMSQSFSPQLYDIWNFAKKTNQVGHYGNTEERIVDNLLYLFTDPFDIVIDPFAGGGSTIDVCKKRARRYWVADRKPIVERAEEIRKHDLNDGVTGPYHWGDVKLVYLDPPYWKQTAGKYSEDESDLANMSLRDFTTTLTGIIDDYGSKLKSGARIACIISPTQWPNEDKNTNYHDLDLIARVGSHLELDRHIIAPYSTEQYNGTQVNIAKEKKLNLVISRRLVIWEVI